MIVFKVRVDDQGTLALDKVGKKAKALEVAFGKTSGLITKAFQGVAMYAGISAFMQAVGNANKEINQFHLNLRKVEQVGGVTGKNLSVVSDQMRKLAQETEYTHTQISAAGVTLARMGINTSEALGNTLTNAMNLATVAGEDLTMTAEGLGQIFNIFNITGKETDVATNKIGVALNKTALDLKGYIEAMQYAGSAAGATKVPFDDLTAAIAFLSQKAITGSRAGTTMKNILISLVKPGSDAGRALKESSVAANDLVGMFKLLSDNNVSIDKIVEMFGMWAAPGALGLQAGVKGFAELRDEIAKGNSDIAKQAEIIRRENIPAFQQLMGAITNVGEIFGQALGIDKGALWNKMKLEVISFGDYLKANEVHFRVLGNNLKTVGEALFKITSVGLKTIVADFTALMATIAGVVVLNNLKSMSGNVATLALNFTNLKTALQGVSTALAAPGMAAIVASAIGAATWKGVDAIIAGREKSQREGEATGDEIRGTRLHINLLKELYDAKIKYETSTSGKRSQAELDSAKRLLMKPVNRLNELGLYSDAYAGKSGTSTLMSNILFYDKKLKTMGPPKPAGFVKPDGSPATLPGAPRAPGSPTLSPFSQDVMPGFNGSGTGQMDSPELKQRWQSVEESASPFSSDAIPGFNRPDGTPTDFGEQMASPEMQLKKDTKKVWEEKYDAIVQLSSRVGDLAVSSTDFLMELDDRRHEKTLANLDKESKAIDLRHARELAAAGNNTFRRSMIEQKYAQQKAALDAKSEKEKKAMAQNDLVRAKIQAAVTFGLVMLSVMKAEAWKGIIGVLTSVATVTAAAFPLVSAITAKNYRSGGTVDGQGNGTSDSVWAKVSRGERILSVDELSRVGGNERVQQMIDRSSNRNSGVNVNINTVYGNKQFVRELITTMKEELAR